MFGWSYLDELRNYESFQYVELIEQCSSGLRILSFLDFLYRSHISSKDGLGLKHLREASLSNFLDEFVKALNWFLGVDFDHVIVCENVPIGYLTFLYWFDCFNTHFIFQPNIILWTSKYYKLYKLHGRFII